MNLTLIGFKNCGKSSVGKLLSSKLAKSFIDTDELMVKKYLGDTGEKLSGCDIYRKHGEIFFRNLESEIISSLADINNYIISSGGGSVLNKDNMLNFKKNSRLIYLYLSFEFLLDRIMRYPLPAFIDVTQPEASFKKVFEERKDIYLNAADVVIETDNKSIIEITDIIMPLAY